MLDGYKPTKRIKEIVNLLDEGLSYAEIAELLFISIRTINWHLDQRKAAIRRKKHDPVMRLRSEVK